MFTTQNDNAACKNKLHLANFVGNFNCNTGSLDNVVEAPLVEPFFVFVLAITQNRLPNIIFKKPPKYFSTAGYSRLIVCNLKVNTVKTARLVKLKRSSLLIGLR